MIERYCAQINSKKSENNTCNIYYHTTYKIVSVIN